MLKRFWFKFEEFSSPEVLNLGCGVTGYDLRDAQRFLHEQVFSVYGERPIKQIVEDVDFSNLESNHVRPNMGNPAVRGIWFPLM